MEVKETQCKPSQSTNMDDQIDQECEISDEKWNEIPRRTCSGWDLTASCWLGNSTLREVFLAQQHIQNPKIPLAREKWKELELWKREKMSFCYLSLLIEQIHLPSTSAWRTALPSADEEDDEEKLLCIRCTVKKIKSHSIHKFITRYISWWSIQFATIYILYTIHK